MGFTPERAEIRFGCGLSPTIAAPASARVMLDRLAGPDHAATSFPIPALTQTLPSFVALRQARRDRKQAKTKADQKRLRKAYRKLVRANRAEAVGWLGHTFLRRALTGDGLRERVTAFWADHFTARGKSGFWATAYGPYVEEAIRPHVTGSFAQLLRAAATSPLMLHYLDQTASIGPNSSRGLKSKGKRGINENLAREMLELHTLGVDGPYTQGDVRELAELLTGLSFSLGSGFTFLPGQAEPGPETVLGITYGGDKARLDDVFRALDDLARHPATATHLARKLAVHFTGDNPEPDLIAEIAARYRDTDGDLMALYDVLLNHPAAWQDGLGNVKQPIDFIGSTFRALDLDPRHMPVGEPSKMRDLILVPMALMGQPYGQAPAPDGWPEADADWITPQRLAARLQWAISVPFRLRRTLPEPAVFLTHALGSTAPEPVRFAARAAETRAEAIGIILASPAFQRF